jgi:2-hydroxychromene-2-carboxylate isomerase
MMTKTVEFFFDVGSPASYLAWTQLPTLCAQQKAQLVYKPMLLGAVFQATGNSTPAAIPAKGRYMSIDLGRFALRYGVPLVINPHFPINTLQLMRAVIGVQLRQPERLQTLLSALMNALWVDPLDFNDNAVIFASLAQAGFSASDIQVLLVDPEVKAALKANTDEALARGVFGAPSIFVGDQLFFGQDRLDFVREALS